MVRTIAPVPALPCIFGVAAFVLGAQGCFNSSATPATPLPDASVDSSVIADDGGAGLDSAPDATQGIDAPSGVDATSPPADAATGLDATSQADAAAQTVQIGPSVFGTNYGSASADGTAMLLVATGTAGIQWSHYEPASGWSTATLLPGSVPALTAQLGIDATGNAFAVWPLREILDSGQNQFVYAVSRYDHASNAWGSVQYPDMTGKSLTQEPALAVNASGEALVIDPPDGLGTGPLYAEHYSGGTWTQEIVIGSQHSYSVPTVYLSDTGLAVATVTVAAAGTQIVTRSGTTWTSGPIYNGTNSPDTFGPQAIVNASGDVLAGWNPVSGAAPIVYQYNAATMAWTGPTSLGTETQSSGRSCGVAVSLTAAGDGVLTRCYDGISGSTQPAIEAYVFTKSTSTWAAPQDANVTGWPYNPAFAFNASGAGLAAYLNTGSSSNTTGPVEISRYTPGSGWGVQSAPENGDAGGTPQYYVTPFISPSGAAWVAWTDTVNTFVTRVF